MFLFFVPSPQASHLDVQWLSQITAPYQEGLADYHFSEEITDIREAGSNEGIEPASLPHTGIIEKVAVYPRPGTTTGNSPMVFTYRYISAKDVDLSEPIGKLLQCDHHDQLKSVMDNEVIGYQRKIYLFIESIHVRQLLGLLLSELPTLRLEESSRTFLGG